MLKIVTVIGARPQFIKAAAVSRAIAKYNNRIKSHHLPIIEIIVHTGQHYDEKMSKVFFDELRIPRPDYNLAVGSEKHGMQTGKMLAKIEEVLIKETPNLVLTYGDTNSTLAGALAASKMHIFSAHVEAGLRSYNRKMPEEINRIIADEISNICFCPSEVAVKNLSLKEKENIQVSNVHTFDFNTQLVFQVGDVMYDSIIFNEKLAEKKSEILEKLGFSPKSYCLATLHRAENTDVLQNLKNILEALITIAADGNKIILPLHPRTKKCIEKYGLEKKMGFALYRNIGAELMSQTLESNLICIDPIGYLDMIQLEKHAQLIFTDSGGVQKEAYFLNVPCITLRNETEWVETVQTGWNVLTGANTENIISAFSMFINQNSLNKKSGLDSMYGDGDASEKIVDIIVQLLTKK